MKAQNNDIKNLIDVNSIQEELPKNYAPYLGEYITVPLTTDISVLSQKQQQLLLLLFDVANTMDRIYWYEAFGNRSELLDALHSNQSKQLVKINYGPWNRLHGNEPIFKGLDMKPAGANFYPKDMTKKEFENLKDPSKSSLYTLIRRNINGDLEVIPYHEAFKSEIDRAAQILKVAARFAEDPGFKKYLELRSVALLTDNYFESDMAWMEMKDNLIDFVVGPIENYEDQLFGYKAAHEAFILIKDKNWSDKLAHYAGLLPELQKQLPVPEQYKAEVPSSNSDLGAYDVVYYAGDCNAGSKTIAINLPNDPKVQLEKGSRRLQLKNSMQAKFDHILVPIAEKLIAPDQRQHIKFQSFFENTMFHEVAHGLGIKNTINGKGPVRPALKEQYSAIEEGKADILGLFLVTKLKEMNELDIDLMDNYVTFMAGIFRSIRFGATSAHAKANLIRFNFFKEMGAFYITPKGYYKIDFEKMQAAMDALSEKILVLQGNGDYEGTKAFVEKYSVFPEELKKALNSLKNIPVDIIFDQGVQQLGIGK